MARLLSDCTSAIFFLLLGLAACVMLATSAPTLQRVHLRETTTIAIYLDSGVRLSHEAISLNSTSVEEEFSATANYTEADIQRLCRIVTYYYFVEAIDNDSNIYYYMKQNALDALAHWNSTYCSGDCNVDLLEFGRKCQRAVLPSLVYEIVNNGGDIDECEWLEHLIREQDLEEKRSQLAEEPFQSCRN